MSYASSTLVSEDRSRAEIEKYLMRYGASEFGYMRRTEQAIIGFVFKNLNIRMEIPLPNPNDDAFTRTATGRPKRGDMSKLYEQEVRRRWRSLCLVIKAKLVAIEDGVASFEQEFMPYMVTADGKTISERMMPLIEAAKGGAALALPAPKGRDQVKKLSASPYHFTSETLIREFCRVIAERYGYWALRAKFEAKEQKKRA